MKAKGKSFYTFARWAKCQNRPIDIGCNRLKVYFRARRKLPAIAIGHTKSPTKSQLALDSLSWSLCLAPIKELQVNRRVLNFGFGAEPAC